MAINEKILFALFFKRLCSRAFLHRAGRETQREPMTIIFCFVVRWGRQKTRKGAQRTEPTFGSPENPISIEKSRQRAFSGYYNSIFTEMSGAPQTKTNKKRSGVQHCWKQAATAAELQKRVCSRGNSRESVTETLPRKGIYCASVPLTIAFPGCRPIRAMRCAQR